MKFLKALLASSALLLASFGLASADQAVFTGHLANEAGLAYANTYTLDLQGNNIDFLSMQAVFSTVTFASQSLTDGAASTATITVSSAPALSGKQGSVSFYIPVSSAAAAVNASVQITIASNSYTAIQGSFLTVNGIAIRAGKEWVVPYVATNTTVFFTTGAAQALASALSQISGITATANSTSSVVQASATIAGAFGNAYTVTSSTPVGVSLSSTNFLGGLDSPILNTAITLAGPRTTTLVSGASWVQDSFSSNTAVNLAAAITSIQWFGPSGLFNPFTAVANTSTVTVSCASSGTFCNLYTASTVTTAIKLSGTSFTGGQDDATLYINGVSLKQGRDWTNAFYSSGTATGGPFSSSDTARNISLAILGNTSLQPIVVSTFNSNVVTATATFPGPLTNYSLLSSTPAALVLSSYTFINGLSTSFSTATNRINIPNSPFTLALPVLYTKTAGFNPGALNSGTTYYVVPVDQNNFSLAATSTGAIAGTPLVSIASQTATGGGTFTLVAGAYTGVAAFKWQMSNDNATWVDQTVSSFSVTSTTTVSSTAYWDFGSPNYRFLRLTNTAPTFGAVQLGVTGYGKQRYGK